MIKLSLVAAVVLSSFTATSAFAENSLTLRFSYDNAQVNTGDGTGGTGTGGTGTGDGTGDGTGGTGDGTGGDGTGGDGTGGDGTGGDGTDGDGTDDGTLDPDIRLISIEEAQTGLQNGTYVDLEGLLYDCVENIPNLVVQDWMPELRELGVGTYQQSRIEQAGEQCSYRPVVQEVSTGEVFYVDFVFVDDEPQYYGDVEEITRTVDVNEITSEAEHEDGTWLPEVSDQKGTFTQSRFDSDYSALFEYKAFVGEELLDHWFVSNDEDAHMETRQVNYNEVLDESSLMNVNVDMSKSEASEYNANNGLIQEVFHPVGTPEYNYSYAVIPGNSNFDDRKASSARLVVKVPDVVGSKVGYYYTGEKIDDDVALQQTLSSQSDLIVAQVNNIPYTGYVDLIANMSVSYTNFVFFNDDGSVPEGKDFGQYDSISFTLNSVTTYLKGVSVGYLNGNSLNKTFAKLSYEPIPI